MCTTVEEVGAEGLILYQTVPSWLRVESVLRVEVANGGLEGLRLVEARVPRPYVKRYDADELDSPTSWPDRYDVGRWGIFLAKKGDVPVGGAAVALDAPVYPMDRFQRSDLAVLADIRVHPNHRRRGIGSKLFVRAADWARRRRRGELGIETQNVNVPACRFYAKMGCQLGAIHRFGYAGCPDVAQEALLLWYLSLRQQA